MKGDPALRNIFNKYQVPSDDPKIRDLLKMIAKAALADELKSNTVRKIISSKAKMIGYIKEGFVEDVILRIKTLAETVLTSENKGIKFAVDKHMGTNRHVFSIIGPHTGVMYGDIMFVLSPDIMHHPDFNMTPHAATSYHSGRTYGHRPWMGQQKTGLRSKPDYDRSKLNGCISKLFLSLMTLALPYPSLESYLFAEEWPVVLAAEIVAQFMVKHKRMPSLDEAKSFYTSHDSHRCIEGHLPSIVPLAFVHKVIMPRAVWDSLSAGTKRLFFKHFPQERKRLLIAPTKPPFTREVYGRMVRKKERDKERIGLYFTLSDNWARPTVICALPHKNANKIKIQFKALGRDIFVALCSSSDLRKASSVYNIALASGQSCTTSIRKGLKKEDKVLASVVNFNQGAHHLQPLVSLQKSLLSYCH